MASRGTRIRTLSVSDPFTLFAASVRWRQEETLMIDDSSTSEAGLTEMREMRRGWAAPSRRGLMGAGAGLLAGASAQLLADEAAAAGSTATLDQLKRAERDPNHRILLKGGMVLSLDPGVGDFETGDVLIGGEKILPVGRNLHATASVVDPSRMILLPRLFR